ncbi:MAG: class I adenylate-forming enzyme family protein [bacterium]|nr:class I adenylate-forming enzyme family protein [bacterium]
MNIPINESNFSNSHSSKSDRENKRQTTGIASVDMPWLSYYESSAFERATNISKNMTVWDIIEKSFDRHLDVPALEYFKREISRPDFANSVYTWARALRGLGIEENEVVPIYGTLFPEIGAITCALNMIGATPYFLKLSMSKKDFEIETSEAKIAIVFDGMWDKVKDVFSDDRFKKVIIATAADSMLSPQKELVTFLNYIEQIKNKSRVPRKDKYIWIDEAKKIANYYTGEVKVAFKSNRNAFITSSSGTSLAGIVKGTIATNESVIAQLYQANNAKINYNAGDRCLNNLPLTASTSLNCLFFLPLFRGMTIINDPRIGEAGYYKQIMTTRANVALTTGSLWEAFFRNVEQNLAKGKKIDLSFAKMWIIGGEGTNLEYFKKWNELMKRCGSETPLYSGYGMSEVFSVLSVETTESFMDAIKKDTPIISVGIPYPGTNVKIVDEQGQELKYNERGELLIKSQAAMKGYYQKPELSDRALADGWIHTGDIFSIDEDGILYLWGRADDKAILPNGANIYLFDLANQIRSDEDIDDVFVNAMPLADGTLSLVAHVIFSKDFVGDKNEKYIQFDSMLKELLPEGISIDGYKEHFVTFKCSPTTVKKDRKGLMKELDGYIKIKDGEEYSLSFELDEEQKLHKNYQRIQTKILKRVK